MALKTKQNKTKQNYTSLLFSSALFFLFFGWLFCLFVYCCCCHTKSLLCSVHWLKNELILYALLLTTHKKIFSIHIKGLLYKEVVCSANRNILFLRNYTSLSFSSKNRNRPTGSGRTKIMTTDPLTSGGLFSVKGQVWRPGCVVCTCEIYITFTRPQQKHKNRKPRAKFLISCNREMIS